MAARLRLSPSARRDLEAILRRSEEEFGVAARRRYAALLSAAFDYAVKAPQGVLTRDRSNVRPGLRSLHLRHCRSMVGGAVVLDPVHVVFYRVVSPSVVAIVRVLHERMEPSSHTTGL